MSMRTTFASNYFRRFGGVIALVLLVGLIPFSAAPSSAQEGPQDLRFFLSFIPNIQFSPVYVAAAKGYFEEEGFNIILEHGDENVGVEQIAVGDIPAGIISGEQVILARANQRPVVYLYQWYNQYPVAAVITSQVPATTFAELRGTRVGIPGFYGANYTGLTALLNANDMTESDIQIETIGFNAPDVLCMGAVDAAIVYINNEPLQVQHRIDSGDCGSITGITTIPVAESTTLVSNGIVVNEQLLSEQPETAAAIVRAFDRGLRDVINNPAEAYLLSADYVDGLPLSPELSESLAAQAEAQTAFLEALPDREAIATSRNELLTSLQETFAAEDLTQFEVLMETIPLWDSDNIGISDEAAWETTQDILLQMGAIDAPIDLGLAFNNDYVPQPEVEGMSTDEATAEASE
jgi:NitT/TauT family transport system substrate-binding protein